MTKTRVVRVFSFIMALTLVLAMVPSFCFADSVHKQQFAAWIASALTAINITVQSTVAPALQLGNDLNNFLSAPFKIEGTQIVDIPYTYSQNDIEEILNKSTLSISGDTVTIDGVDYTDIWLSHDAADKFRVNAFDLENAWDIASESEGTFVSGVGTLDGMPLFNSGTRNLTQYYTLGFGNNGVGNAVVYVNPSNGASVNITASNGRTSSSQNYWHNSNPGSIQFISSNNDGNGTYSIYNGVNRANGSFSGFPHTNEQFDFDWVAGTIPAEELPENDGLHIFVPNNPEQWQEVPEAQQVINNINNYYELNPDLSPGVDVDLNTPGIIDKLDDLMDLINGIIKLTRAINGPKEQTPEDPIEPDPQPIPYPDPQPEPYPEPDPEPGTPVSSIDWSSLFDVLKNIFQKLSSIDVTLQNIANHIVELRNRFEEWFNSIREAINNIAEKIVTGNKDWFSDIVDSIWNPFLRLFGIFKANVGIWHYVVEWINYISIPFRFYFNVLTGLGPLYTSPIYATFAGVLVIAIYRRFGR